MIEVITKEYSEDGVAVRYTEITLFSMPIFKQIKTSTNQQAVAILTTDKPAKIKGFKYEVKNKSKKNKQKHSTSESNK